MNTEKIVYKSGEKSFEGFWLNQAEIQILVS